MSNTPLHIKYAQINSHDDVGTCDCAPNEAQYFFEHPYKDNDEQELDFTGFEAALRYLEEQYPLEEGQ